MNSARQLKFLAWATWIYAIAMAAYVWAVLDFVFDELAWQDNRCEVNGYRFDACDDLDLRLYRWFVSPND